MAAMSFPAYVLDWYREIGSRDPLILPRALAWHAIAYVTPLVILLGPGPGVAAWLAFWVLPSVTVVPFLRRIGELEEHSYDRAPEASTPGTPTEFSTTFLNVGLLHRWFIHPAGDAWHEVHHLFPAIPMRNQRAAHRLLLRVPEYHHAPVRTRVLDPAPSGTPAGIAQEQHP